MYNTLWRYLQVFADGGEDAGDGTAETVVQPADDGQGELRKRGFTDAQIVKIQKDMARRSPKGTQSAVAKQAAPAQDQQSSAAASNETSPAEEATQEESQPTLAELLKKYPNVNGEVQEIVKNRLKSARGSEDTLKSLTPLLSLVAKQYGQELDPEHPDYDALIDAYSHDESNYEGIALEQGRSSKQVMDETLETLEQQRFTNHFRKLEQQGEELRKVFPNFDLRAEMQNPAFARMTAPNIGISVEDAYYAIHRNEIQQAAMQVTAQKTAEKLSNAVQSGSRRPMESGTSSQAPSVSTFSYANATRQQQEAFKAELRRAWGRGETVYPGSRR